MKIQSIALMPIAWIYDMVTSLRNWMYDRGIVRSMTFDCPTICIGNLAVGGTGKTPHTEYLIRLLQKEGLHVAVLSRGYRRKTRGYVLATAKSTVGDIGDEPYQMFHKFCGLTVAVDADRCEGVTMLMSGNTPPDVILLDDAFQHRSIKAGLNILLTDNSLTFDHDHLLPAGRLRENKNGSRRADVVIITKCPNCKTDDKTMACLKASFGLTGSQMLMRSHMKYGKLSNGMELSQLAGYTVVLVTGIANPRPLEEKIRQHCDCIPVRFPDHHNFSKSDIERIENIFASVGNMKKLMVTTEKDFTRLSPLLHDEALCTIPIEIEIMDNQQEVFNKTILDYVRKD